MKNLARNRTGIIGVFCCLLIGGAVYGQDGPPKWTAGGIGLLYESPFGAEGTSFNAFPYVSYRGERFYLQGLEAGYRLLPPRGNPNDVHVSFDIIASARTLAGSSRDKITADAGVRLGLHGGFGSLTASFLQDVTDTHNGQEVSVGYSYSFRSGRLTVTPGISASWQSRKLANHMWGVTVKQRAKMIEDGKDAILPVYQLSDDVINYSAELTALYRVGDRWSVIAFGSSTYLDDKVWANPGITKKYDLTLGFGVGYSF
ncbi:MipA/OmpV family protein [Kordiimonas aestuarii]|uniref:MipA/OmpV family protein n=1 Tax=Kordiimonas aestuarii TaxID=1005925 RepID=UPI0021CF7414|nr:MipA/OmpV family protein [Kordiimonas aestuarii]